VTVRRYAMTLCLTMVLLAVVTTVARAGQAFPFPPTQPSTPAQPAADPRLAQIRQWLEAKGFRVLEVESRRTSAGDAQWWTETAARYAQPTGDKVIDQAFFIWAAMYEPLKQEDGRTYLSGSQLWTKYKIIFHARLSELTAFVQAYQAARSDAERGQAVSTLLGQALFAVFDVERGQQVDQKDFINKNFTR
jgi:hypothetical protein